MDSNTDIFIFLVILNHRIHPLKYTLGHCRALLKNIHTLQFSSHETATGTLQTVAIGKTCQKNMTDKVTDKDRAEKRKNFVYSVLIGQEVLVTVCRLPLP